MLNTMMRLRILGSLLAAAGLILAGTAFAYGAPTAHNGLHSAQAMYEAQGVTLNYNDEGQLVDRGDAAQAQTILAMLEGEWQYPVDHDNLDPNDPLVNTRDELMYQYAVITYHVLHGTVDVELTADDVPITYRDVTYTEPGVYEIEVGKYYAELDRSHPIERQLRGAWDPLALSLLAALAGGHANQAAGELAAMVSIALGSVGLLISMAGAGLVWVTWGARTVPVGAPSRAPSRMPVRAQRAGIGPWPHMRAAAPSHRPPLH